MEIKSLELYNFRNYERFTSTFSKGANIIYGKNAQGKTNLLEAISYISTGKSFRARRDRELIRFGEPCAGIKADIELEDRSLSLEVNLFSTNQRRKLLKNGLKLKTASELSGVFNSVLFVPEDLTLIRDGAAVRRKFLDSALCQLRPRYAKALSEYNKLHEHKTRILKDWEEKPDLLKVLNDFSQRMAVAGAIIISYRGKFLKMLAEHAGNFHSECSGNTEELLISYKTVSTVDDALAPVSEIYDEIMRHQHLHKKAELDSRFCLTGPHKDDFEACINSRQARYFSSQGQARTAALAIKLAEREIFRADTGQMPVLLLDDILSELDRSRREFVLAKIEGGQVFISCCETELLESLEGSRSLLIEGGRLVG